MIIYHVASFYQALTCSVHSKQYKNDKKILLYAINNNGYKNLVKLSTIISSRNLTIDDLINYKKDLLLIIKEHLFLRLLEFYWQCF